MQLSQLLMKYYPRYMFTYKEHEVHFKAETQLHLRARVSGKRNKRGSKNCVQEMFLMMSCMKNNEFNEGLCGKEVADFKNCNHEMLEMKKKAKERALRTLVEGRDLTTGQLNNYMKKFPQEFNDY